MFATLEFKSSQRTLALKGLANPGARRPTQGAYMPQERNMGLEVVGAFNQHNAIKSKTTKTKTKKEAQQICSHVNSKKNKIKYYNKN